MKKTLICTALILGLFLCIFKAYSQDPKEKIKNNLIGTWVLNDDASIKIVYDSNNNKKIYHRNVLKLSFKFMISETCDTQTLTNGQYFIKSTDTEDNDETCEVVEALSSRNNITTLSLRYDGQYELLTKQSYFNTVLTAPFKKTNCGIGEGISLDYTVAAGTYSSAVSQQDADNQAKADVAKNGQKYVNDAINGYCIYYNTAITGSLTKTNCPKGMYGTSSSYTIPARRYTSEISQADADALARAEWNVKSKNFGGGSCFYQSNEKTGTFTKNNCSTGGAGSTVVYRLGIAAYTSPKSQADADALAAADVTKNGQANANAKGFCTFKSKAASSSFQKNNCGLGKTGSFVTYSAAAGTFTSVVSEVDADAQFQKAGQTNANLKGTCK